MIDDIFIMIISVKSMAMYIPLCTYTYVYIRTYGQVKPMSNWNREAYITGVWILQLYKTIEKKEL